MSKDLAASETADAAGDTGFWGAPEEDGNAVAATHWDLGGSLMVLDGEILIEQSELGAGLLGPEQERLCDGVVNLEEAVRIEDVPEEAVYAWWQIRVLEPEPNSCFEGAFPIPDPMYLGIGAMHPEIRAVMGSDDTLSGASVSTLNAIYASFEDDDTLWVFGAAGTPEAFEGEVDAVDSFGGMDGYWQFEPLYSFPL